MLIKEFTFKNVCLQVYANAKSVDNIYLTESGDFKTLDENFLLKEINFIRSSPNFNKRKKQLFKIELVATTNAELDKFIKRENAWVEEKLKSIDKRSLGGITTILSRLK